MLVLITSLITKAELWGQSILCRHSFYHCVEKAMLNQLSGCVLWSFEVYLPYLLLVYWRDHFRWFLSSLVLLTCPNLFLYMNMCYFFGNYICLIHDYSLPNQTVFSLLLHEEICPSPIKKRSQMANQRVSFISISVSFRMPSHQHHSIRNKLSGIVWFFLRHIMLHYSTEEILHSCG